MKIAVCVRRVPDTSEALVKVDETGRDIVKDKLAFTINESDNYALEEALLLKESAEAEVTLVTVGAKDCTDVLRMGLAKGASRAVRIDDAGLEQADGLALAHVLAGFFSGEPFDLIFTGCIAQDIEDSQVGAALAQYLGRPHAAYVVKLEKKDGRFAVRRELEGGLLEVEELPMPCVVSIQTGGNTPRYASIMGIKRAGARPLEEKGTADLGLADADFESKTKLLRLYVPEVLSAAEMIEGDTGEKAARLAEILKAKGLV